MCGCNSNFGSPCCPTAQYFQEQVCGDFAGPLTASPAWTNGVTDYVQATVAVFAVAGTVDAGDITITLADGTVVKFPEITAGNTVSISVLTPVGLEITADAGDVGRFCMTLYKRLLP